MVGDFFILFIGVILVENRCGDWFFIFYMGVVGCFFCWGGVSRGREENLNVCFLFGSIKVVFYFF